MHHLPIEAGADGLNSFQIGMQSQGFHRVMPRVGDVGCGFDGHALLPMTCARGMKLPSRKGHNSQFGSGGVNRNHVT